MAKSRRVRSRRGLYAWGLKPPTTQGGAGPIIGCAYPLDADEAEVQGFGAQGKPDMSADEQTGSWTLAGDTSTFRAALSAGILSGTPTVISATTGKVAVELGVLSLPSLIGNPSDGQRAIISLPIFNLGLSDIWNVRALAIGDGTFQAGVADSFSNLVIHDDLATPPSEIAVVLDHDNSLVYARYKGQYYALADWTPEPLSIGLGLNELNGGEPADVGKVISGRVRTDSTEYTGDYGSGTTDACGTALPDSTTYPLDATAAELQGAGLDGRLTPVDSLTALHTFPDGIIQTDLGYSAGLSAPHAVLDLSTGAVALEFGVHLPFFTPEVATAGSTVVAAKCLLVDGANFVQETSTSFTITDDGVYAFVTSDGVGGTTSTNSSSGDHRVGLLLDNVGGVMRAWLNGVEIDLATSGADALPSDTSSLRVLLQLTCANSDDNGLAGEHVLLSLIENPDNFTTPFPAGSRDINGNVFN